MVMLHFLSNVLSVLLRVDRPKPLIWGLEALNSLQKSVMAARASSSISDGEEIEVPHFYDRNENLGLAFRYLAALDGIRCRIEDTRLYVKAPVWKDPANRKKYLDNAKLEQRKLEEYEAAAIRYTSLLREVAEARTKDTATAERHARELEAEAQALLNKHETTHSEVRRRAFSVDAERRCTCERMEQLLENALQNDMQEFQQKIFRFGKILSSAPASYSHVRMLVWFEGQAWLGEINSTNNRIRFATTSPRQFTPEELRLAADLELASKK
jgi:hypothetical protein